MNSTNRLAITQRQRGDSSRPVGNKSGMSRSDPIYRNQFHVDIQAANNVNDVTWFRPAFTRDITWSVGAASSKRTAQEPRTQPMAFVGWREIIRALMTVEMIIVTRVRILLALSKALFIGKVAA